MKPPETLSGRVNGLGDSAAGPGSRPEVVSGPGEVILIPALIQHWASLVEDTEAVDCKNIVPGWSVTNARWEK